MQLSESTKLLASDVTRELSAAGVLVVPAGPKVVRFVPPLIVTKEEVSEAMSRLDACFTKLVAAQH